MKIEVKRPWIRIECQECTTKITGPKSSVNVKQQLEFHMGSSGHREYMITHEIDVELMPNIKEIMEHARGKQ